MQVYRLQRFLDDLVAAGAPGAAARLADGENIQYAASGLADLQGKRLMEPDLCFRAGSVTKTFVATLVLQLASEGTLGLDDPVERWFPGIVTYANDVSIRHLLSHTSGMPDYVPSILPALHSSEHRRLHTWAPRELIDLTAGEPQRFSAGSAWAYSNTGYVLLGMIVERATNVMLAELIDRRIVGPLALEGTLLPTDSWDVPEPMARGYGYDLDARWRPTGPLLDYTLMNPSWAWASGGMISTLDDLGVFFHALLTGKLIPAPLLAEMLTTRPVPRDALPLPVFDGYGLGIVEVDMCPWHLVGQAGGILGYLNMVLACVDGSRQLGVVINIGEVAPPPVNEAFMRALRELGRELVATPALSGEGYALG